MSELRDIAVKYAHLMWVSDYRKLLNTADEIERLQARVEALEAENRELDDLLALNIWRDEQGEKDAK